MTWSYNGFSRTSETTLSEESNAVSGAGGDTMTKTTGFVSNERISRQTSTGFSEESDAVNGSGGPLLTSARGYIATFSRSTTPLGIAVDATTLQADASPLAGEAYFEIDGNATDTESVSGFFRATTEPPTGVVDRLNVAM